MSLLKDRLKKAMDEHHPPIIAADLARRIPVSKATVSDWLSGKTRDIVGEKLFRAADILQVSSKWLATGKGPARPALVAENPAPYQTHEKAVAAMEQATRFLFTHKSAEDLELNGPEWTAKKIILLYDVFSDPASNGLNKETILKLIN